MTKTEVLAKINSDPALKGLDIYVDQRRPIIEVNGFNRTADWKATKAILQAMGFDCMPNSGIIYTDDQPAPVVQRQLSPEEQWKLDVRAIINGQHLADPKREQAILSGKTYAEYTKGE